MLEPIENHLRSNDVLDSAADLVVRGWPLTIDGMLRNADATRNRFSRGGEPFIAISAEVTIAGWDLDAILAGPRLRTRSRYASAPVAAVQAAQFELLPTFVAPHYSVVLRTYTEEVVQRLLDVLGEPIPNPHFIGRRS
ncbi:MAG: hypothetical protein ACRD02_00235 [Acidimicrobiia bacterium]